MKIRFGEWFLRADFIVDGIRMRLIIAAAVLQVFFAPMWDHAIRAQRVAANLEPATFLSTLFFITLITILAGGRLMALSADDTEEAVPSRWVRLKKIAAAAARMTKGYLMMLKREPLAQVVARAGAILCVSLMALRGAVGLIRWCLWKSINGLEAALPGLGIWSPFRTMLEWVYFREKDVLSVVVLLSVPTALAAAYVFLQRPVSAMRGIASRDLHMLANVEPLIDRRDPNGRQVLGAVFNGSTREVVTGLLQDLSRWEPDRSVRDENSCRDHIAFFLWQRGYQVATERWISSEREGRRRVDLVIDGCIALELKYGIHAKGAGERDRVFGQVFSYANIWGNTGPVLLFLARTPRSSAERFSEPAGKWNADLGDQVAPIVVIADS